MNNPIFSIIIPHRNSPALLKRLLLSIPDNENIEVIVVDNSEVPFTKDSIDGTRDYTLLYSDKKGGAGKARNEGLKNAHGEWLIFSDADDYFTKEAFNYFILGSQSDADIVFFKVEGLCTETGERTHRGDQYNNFIETYTKSGYKDDRMLRYKWGVPWGKMIKAEIVKQNNILFDEVVASNDLFFSLKTGFYANRVSVINETVYIVTVNKGSLITRRDYTAIKSRYEAKLRCNKFLRDNHLYGEQHSIMAYLKKVPRYGISPTFEFLRLLFYYKQNPFTGWRNWISNYRRKRKG